MGTVLQLVKDPLNDCTTLCISCSSQFGTVCTLAVGAVCPLTHDINEGVKVFSAQPWESSTSEWPADGLCATDHSLATPAHRSQSTPASISVAHIALFVYEGVVEHSVRVLWKTRRNVCGSHPVHWDALFIIGGCLVGHNNFHFVNPLWLLPITLSFICLKLVTRLFAPLSSHGPKEGWSAFNSLHCHS